MDYAKEFENNKYVKIPQFLNEGMSQFLYEYIVMQESSMKYLVDNNLIYDKIAEDYRNFFGAIDNEKISFFDPALGKRIDKVDDNRTNCYCRYADPAFETLLGGMVDPLGKILKKELHPNYSYCRIYRTGNELKKHKDRSACEISVTLCLGYENGDKPWDIFMGEDESNPITLQQGDAIIYRGCDVTHWRHAYEGVQQAQVFMHYNDKNGPLYKPDMGYDERPCLAVPRRNVMIANAENRLFYGGNKLANDDMERPSIKEQKMITPDIPWEKLT
tara:strand:- start:647 stop:1468 length:822 start_codon:yes stop_codon:yes gene_type:complete